MEPVPSLWSHWELPRDPARGTATPPRMGWRVALQEPKSAALAQGWPGTRAHGR